MSEISDFFENAIVNLMRAVAFTEVAAYVALFTTATADDGTGTEVSGTNYARQLAGLAAPSPAGVSSNGADITFPTAGVGGWGTVTHVALMDAVSGGNMLMHSVLDASKAVNDGDTFKINAGDLDVTIE